MSKRNYELKKIRVLCKLCFPNIAPDDTLIRQTPVDPSLINGASLCSQPLQLIFDEFVCLVNDK